MTAVAGNQRPGAAARRAALDLLEAVLVHRQNLDEVWQRDLAPGRRLEALAARDRAFARLLATTVLRRLGQIDAALAACLDRPLKGRAARVRPILRLAAAQLLFLATPPHAAVDAAVDQSRRYPGYGKLVNAVLRRLAREGAGLVAEQDAGRLNCPDWLWRAWGDAYGADRAAGIAAQHLLESRKRSPPPAVTKSCSPSSRTT